ncbi:MAG: YbaB/EbfC family nucleoid-associated protein [bacterium]|nr:YbaB/EbfC family nucleoid-associated protein [bacterium]
MDIRMLMKQAQQMQAKMAKAQEELAAKEVTAEVAGGQVKVVMDGKHNLKSISIAPEAMDPEDAEFLQDLVLAAVNEAVKKVDELVEQEMGSVTGGLNIPGMKLPGMG